MTLKQYLKYYAAFLTCVGCDRPVSDIPTNAYDSKVGSDTYLGETTCIKTKISGTSCVLCDRFSGGVAITCDWTSDKFKPEAEDEK